MQLEVKALQQQALATQAALKQLKTRESVDPLTAVTSDLPSLSTHYVPILGVASTLMVALALVWWYLWRRPQTRFVDATRTARPDLRVDSDYTPQFKVQHQLQPTNGPSTLDNLASDHSVQAEEVADANDWLSKDSPDTGFDSEAAAGEVARVRNSLAKKREERLRLREQEEPASAPEQPELGTIDPRHLSGEAPFGDSLPPVDRDIQFTLPCASAALEAPIDSVRLSSADGLDFNFDEFEVPAPVDLDMPIAIDSPLQASQDLQLDVENEVAAQPEPAFEPEHHEPVESHFAITMALAQESAALELWAVARDMATEVLESEDASLQAEAQALLDRLKDLESHMDPETTAWKDLR